MIDGLRRGEGKQERIGVGGKWNWDKKQCQVRWSRLLEGEKQEV